jgi:hypothetical protein
MDDTGKKQPVMTVPPGRQEAVNLVHRLMEVCHRKEDVLEKACELEIGGSMVSRERLLSSGNRKGVTNLRHATSYVLRQFGLSFAEIGVTMHTSRQAAHYAFLQLSPYIAEL